MCACVCVLAYSTDVIWLIFLSFRYRFDLSSEYPEPESSKTLRLLKRIYTCDASASVGYGRCICIGIIWVKPLAEHIYHTCLFYMYYIRMPSYMMMETPGNESDSRLRSLHCELCSRWCFHSMSDACARPTCIVERVHEVLHACLCLCILIAYTRSWRMVFNFIVRTLCAFPCIYSLGETNFSPRLRFQISTYINGYIVGYGLITTLLYIVSVFGSWRIRNPAVEF